MSERTEIGWAWFDPKPQHQALPGASEADADLAQAFARCFRGADADRVMEHLKAQTLDRVLGPGVPDGTLRYVEGQRQLVAYVAAMIERGRRGAL